MKISNLVGIVGCSILLSSLSCQEGQESKELSRGTPKRSLKSSILSNQIMSIDEALRNREKYLNRYVRIKGNLLNSSITSGQGGGYAIGVNIGNGGNFISCGSSRFDDNDSRGKEALYALQKEYEDGDNEEIIVEGNWGRPFVLKKVMIEDKIYELY